MPDIVFWPVVGFAIYAILSFIFKVAELVLDEYAQKQIIRPVKTKGPLDFFRNGIRNLLVVSGDKDVKMVYEHFDMLCTSIEDEIEKHKLDQDEFQKLLDQMIRPLISHFSAICLKLNKTQAMKLQVRKQLRKLRSTATSQKKNVVAQQKKIKQAKSKESKKLLQAEIESLKEKLNEQNARILEEEENFQVHVDEYKTHLVALDEIICLMHHDFLNCPTIQQALLLGKKLPESTTRCKIQEELELLLDSTKREEEFLRYYEESQKEAS